MKTRGCILVLAALIAISPIDALPAIGNCGSNDDGGSSGTSPITATVNVTGGTGHIVAIGASYIGGCSGAIISLTNGQGDTINLIGAAFTTNGVVCTLLGFINSPTGNASATYSMAPNVAEYGRTIVVCEASGLATSPLDQGPAGNESGSTTDFVSGSVTTTVASEIVFAYTGMTSYGSTVAAGASSICAVAPGCAIPASALSATHYGAMEYLIVSATQTGTMDFTRGAVASADTGIASFKGAGGSSPAQIRHRVTSND